MKASHSFFYFLLSAFITDGCGRDRTLKKTPRLNHHPHYSKVDRQKETTSDIKPQQQSFVVSCGSGCAMTYSADRITGSYPIIKVRFNVEMYIDDQLSDTYSETYHFSYNRSNQLAGIYREATKEDVLNSLPPNAHRAFRKFGKGLISDIRNRQK